MEMLFVFFNDTATTEIYTLSLHDALPIFCKVVHGDQSTLFLTTPDKFLRNITFIKTIVSGIDRLFRSEEHTSELQSRQYLVCRLLLEKKNYIYYILRPPHLTSLPPSSPLP